MLDRLPGVDAAGYAGLADNVDLHWGRIFAGAAVSSLIGIGAELASPSRDANGNAVILAGRDSLQSSITDVGQQLTQRNLDVQPTLTVRPGFPLRIIVNRDIVFR
jgi:type IV secretion system protein VirB10